MARKDKLNLSRRDFIKSGAFALAGLALPGRKDIERVLASRDGGSQASLSRILAMAAAPKLSDPALQPKFVNFVPNALDPGFIYQPAVNGEYTVGAGAMTQWTGLVNAGGNPVPTALWGYGAGNLYTWPGKTFQIQRDAGNTIVNWENNLFGVTQHLLPVDRSLHWAYSLPGYQQYTIETNGVPIITHLHGGHTDFQYDGNPEFFFTPGAAIFGPQWANVPGGFTNRFEYDNNVPAGTLWYHDHALGITRLNVYAGMAGFYFVRDDVDTGQADNRLGLPAWPYELAYAIQDRMFKKGGELFYPALPNDPFWADFITGLGLKNGDVPKPSALAEFFGDHMVVNGVIWPKANVEPRHYRLRLLNGCDSRFLAIRFRAVPAGATDLLNAGPPLPFYVIGSDQGLAAQATEVAGPESALDYLLVNPGERYDVVFDFSRVPFGSRVIMENIGGDAPFGGVVPGPQDFGETNRVMAFDVLLTKSDVPDSFDPGLIGQYGGNAEAVTRTRKVALFEGTDEYGRLQPLLGTAEPATDLMDQPVLGMNGTQLEGAIAWHSPTTENPALDATEIWEIYNVTMDAHPVHLHLVNFEIIDRESFVADVIPTTVLQHNGTFGTGAKLANIVLGNNANPATGVEKAPKDMVTALPGEVTRIKATFDKAGRYVWHCHILSHEDHEMMRVLHVGPGA